MAKRIFEAVRGRLGRLSARAHLHGSSDGRGGGARGPEGHPATTVCSPTWSKWAAVIWQRRLKERFGQSPVRRRHSRARPLLGRSSSFADRSEQSSHSIPQLKLHARVKREAMARGLMVYPDGRRDRWRQARDHVLLAPPFIVDGAAGRCDRRAPGLFARGCSRRRTLATRVKVANPPHTERRVQEADASVRTGYVPPYGRAAERQFVGLVDKSKGI